MYHQKLGLPIESGISTGCPFCKATMLGMPKPGNIIRLLTGYHAGDVVMVVDNKYNIPLSSGQFLVKYENDPLDRYITINGDGMERILFEYIPPSPIPNWAPPICLRYAEELDNQLIRFWVRSLRPDGCYEPRIDAFYEVITYIWYNRLPLRPEELWAVLDAHGFPYKFKKRLTQLYQEGMDLLIYATGRQPFKNRRVEPLSVRCKK